VESTVISGSTDADGHYAFTHLHPGIYDVRTSARGGSLAGLRSGIELGEGEAKHGIDLELGAAGSLSGRVLGAGGALDPAFVMVLGEGGKSILGGATVENGRFHMDGLPPGEVTLQARTKDRAGPQVRVQVRSGETTEVDLALDP
jgi:hypothetical protein